MAYYKLSDVLECIQDYSKLGFKFLEISEVDGDDSDLQSLSISGISKDESVDDQIDAIEYPF